MKCILSLLICASVAAVAWGCCFPDQWEGVQLTTGGYTGVFNTGMIEERSYVAYDAKGKRSAVCSNYKNGYIEAHLRIVVLFGEANEGGVVYVDYLDKHKCWKKQIKDQFRKSCIPQNAKKVGSAFLGLKKTGFEVTSYLSECPVKKGKITVAVQTLGEGLCAPVSAIVSGTVGKVSPYKILNTIDFTDITPGISNTTMFDVPKDCSENWDDFFHPDPDFVINLHRHMFIMMV